MPELKRTDLRVGREKAILVGVVLPDTPPSSEAPLAELTSLAETAGAKVVGTIVQKRQHVHPKTYLGSGKVLEIATLAKAQDAQMVIFDNDLSPGQIGELETIINEHIGSVKGKGIKVLDRSELILDIFASRARTHEAKLQVELAQLEYTYPRLASMWDHLERIASGTMAGVGARGPGEQQLEIDRRLVRKRVGDLKSELAIIQGRREREVERRGSRHFTVSIVGYTNAGKSTLFNTLTGAGTYADDRLFATLDTKTRQWRLGPGIDVMLSDTVGFVKDLPHHLVASFRATLEETVHADLLLHVVDISSGTAEQQFEAVKTVLRDIGADQSAELLLLNKVDAPGAAKQADLWRAMHPDSLIVSALSGFGLVELIQRVRSMVQESHKHIVVDIPADDGRLVAFLQRNASVVSVKYTEGTARYEMVVPARLCDELRANPGVRIVTESDSPEPAKPPAAPKRAKRKNVKPA